jgi:23S rRNA pseudouridine1911/1915/1917 synthase
VPKGTEGARIDVVIAQCVSSTISRRAVRRLIDAGAVSVDGIPLRVLSRRVNAGARIEIRGLESTEVAAPLAEALAQAVPIIALDADVVVVNKPSGMPTEPTRQGAPGTCSHALRAQLAAQGDDVRFLSAAHRLDTDTSGIVVFARSSEAAAALGAQFAAGSIDEDERAAKPVERTYLALVHGAVPETLVLEAPLSRLPGAKAQVVVDEAGKPARTELERLVEGKDASLVLCTPRTGRLHQVRVHLAHAGHPLVGDRRYGPEATAKKAAHLGLHAVALVISHPATRRRVRYTALPPQAFLKACAAHGIDLAALEHALEEKLHMKSKPAPSQPPAAPGEDAR